MIQEKMRTWLVCGLICMAYLPMMSCFSFARIGQFQKSPSSFGSGSGSPFGQSNSFNLHSSSGFRSPGLTLPSVGYLGSTNFGSSMGSRYGSPFGNSMSSPFGPNMGNSMSSPFGPNMGNSMSSPFGPNIGNSMSSPFGSNMDSPFLWSNQGSPFLGSNIGLSFGSPIGSDPSNTHTQSPFLPLDRSHSVDLFHNSASDECDCEDLLERISTQEKEIATLKLQLLANIPPNTSSNAPPTDAPNKNATEFPQVKTVLEENLEEDITDDEAKNVECEDDKNNIIDGDSFLEGETYNDHVRMD